ncbi:MAG: hypothetical protein HC871_13365 [Rhizobiales bacterium]|nr:hypothetical protein [Hyphomicrobiales bacterium]
MLVVIIAAGTAMVPGKLWRDVAMARTEAAIAEARAEMAAIDALANQPAAIGGDIIILALAGIGLLLALLCLLRPTIILGR